jgi:hypothetical protein
VLASETEREGVVTPTPDAKSAQPEQLVEALERRGRQRNRLRDFILQSDSQQAQRLLVVVNELAIADRTLATALSECRERERALAEQMQEFVECGVVSKASLSAAVRRALAAQPPSEAPDA